MNKQSGIAIIGFSSVASLVSLLLSEKEVEHSYHVKQNAIPFLAMKPLSNPIVNGPARGIERKFIGQDYLQRVKYISDYESVSLDENFKPYRITSGTYRSETYALDNRIRFHCFDEAIKKSPYTELITYHKMEALIKHPKAALNIIGGGDSFAERFSDMENLPTQHFQKKRDLFFFNLVCDKEIYNKYATKVNLFYISKVGEILIYPFLHVNEKHTINLTLNVIKGSRWDCFDSEKSGTNALAKLMELFASDMPELADDLKECELAETDFTIHRTKPYYKHPAKTEGNHIFVGVGDAITKSDPLIGQGYNSGSDMGKALVELIAQRLPYSDVEAGYSEYAKRMETYLYHINRTSTQENGNRYLREIYDMAVTNKPLRDFLFSTYDDISLYFPWLIDETETQKLIQKYSRK